MSPLDKTMRMIRGMFPGQEQNPDEIPTADMLMEEGAGGGGPEDMDDIWDDEPQPPPGAVADALSAKILMDQRASRQYQDEVEVKNIEQRKQAAALRTGRPV